MRPETDDLTRLAVFTAWGERCVWCRRPLFFSETELDHLIPKSLDAESVACLIDSHGLPLDFDVLSVGNLAPSCGPCNSGKGAKPPPDAPAITLVLRAAASRAAELEEDVEKLRGRRKLEVALPVVIAAAAGGDESVREALVAAADTITTEVATATGDHVERLHPALRLLYGSWTLVGRESSSVATVTDGERVGYTGTDLSFMCPTCGSYGPWNGVICLVCGQRSEPE